MFYSRFSLFTLLLFAVVLNSCGSQEEAKKQSIEIDLKDAVTQQIFNIRSSRNNLGEGNTEALTTFLAVENPSHRYIAALSLGSLQDSAAIDALADALKDPYPEVRKAAAFALGQMGQPQAAQILAQHFINDSVRTVLSSVLEGVGRSGDEEQLKFLCSSRPYMMQDSLLLEGLALGLYRFSLRRMVQPEGTRRIMNDYIANALMPDAARFIAANYLARTPGLDLSKYENVLSNNALEEKDPNTLMFLVLGLAKSKVPKALNVLKQVFRQSDDYRVRCNILRGLHHFNYDSCKTIIADALYDTSLHVRVVAADYLYSYGQPKDAIEYYEWAEAHPSWRVRARLGAASLHHMQYYMTNSLLFVSTKLKLWYNESQNIYEKAALMQALGSYPANYEFITSKIFPEADSITVSPIIMSNGATALLNLYQHPDFEKVLPGVANNIRSGLELVFRRCVTSGDVGAIAVIAEAIANPDYNFKKVYTNDDFLRKAQQKLELPRDLETFIYLQKAIDYINDRPFNLPKSKQNFVEIDWPILNALGENPKAIVYTSKGKITFDLLHKEAPATVMQFVQLVKTGYYEKKSFHRVVPNFVAQAGCPRGDGWGGFKVNVVSEFSHRQYDEAGRVGMASAGKDTESAQFFITHSPTIHLDGRYTIFAQVSSGMEVVHQLEVGDVIQKIELQ